MDFQFNPVAFADNLKYMGMGMLGIFMVMGLLIVCCFALNHFTNLKSNQKDEK